MSISRSLLPQPDPLRAVAVSRDLQRFDLLIDDMEAELGQGWADLDFENALAFFQQDDARRLEFAVIAADRDDAAHLPAVAEVIKQARRVGLRTILVVDGLGEADRATLIAAGVDDWTTYPLQENALAKALGGERGSGRATERRGEVSAEDVVELAPASEAPRPMRRASDHARGDGEAGGAAQRRTDTGGAVFAVQSAAGGDGATTVAVNLAWELATIDKARSPRICLIDLGLQFGSVATYLDLPRKPMIYEVLSDVAAMDEQAFRQALVTYRDRLHVFTAPAEILPLDLIGPVDVTGLLTLARRCFDIVIVDMPATVTGWTDAVFKLCDLYFVVCGLEVRSAQNALRFQKLLQAEGLATEKLSFVLNRAPSRMGGRGRVDRMAESLGIKFHAVLPDGGRQVTEVNDQAAPLSTLAPRNGLTKELRKVAHGLHGARVAIATRSTADVKPRRKFLGIAFG